MILKRWHLVGIFMLACMISGIQSAKKKSSSGSSSGSRGSSSSSSHHKRPSSYGSSSGSSSYGHGTSYGNKPSGSISKIKTTPPSHKHHNTGYHQPVAPSYGWKPDTKPVNVATSHNTNTGNYGWATNNNNPSHNIGWQYKPPTNTYSAPSGFNNYHPYYQQQHHHRGVHSGSNNYVPTHQHQPYYYNNNQYMQNPGHYKQPKPARQVATHLGAAAGGAYLMHSYDTMNDDYYRHQRHRFNQHGYYYDSNGRLRHQRNDIKPGHKNSDWRPSINTTDKDYVPPVLVPFLLGSSNTTENNTLVADVSNKYKNDTQKETMEKAAETNSYLITKLRPKQSEILKVPTNSSLFAVPVINKINGTAQTSNITTNTTDMPMVMPLIMDALPYNLTLGKGTGSHISSFSFTLLCAINIMLVKFM